MAGLGLDMAVDSRLLRRDRRAVASNGTRLYPSFDRKATAGGGGAVAVLGAVC